MDVVRKTILVVKMTVIVITIQNVLVIWFVEGTIANGEAMMIAASRRNVNSWISHYEMHPVL